MFWFLIILALPDFSYWFCLSMGLLKKKLNFWTEQSSLDMQALDLSCYSEAEFHPPLIWNYYEKPQFYNTWARKIMATNPSVSAEEHCSLMVRLLGGVQKTLSCVPFWSSEWRKEWPDWRRSKGAPWKSSKGWTMGTVKKNWRNFSLEKKKTSPNYSGTKECSERG